MAMLARQCIAIHVQQVQRHPTLVCDPASLRVQVWTKSAAWGSSWLRAPQSRPAGAARRRSKLSRWIVAGPLLRRCTDRSLHRLQRPLHPTARLSLQRCHPWRQHWHRRQKQQRQGPWHHAMARRRVATVNASLFWGLCRLPRCIASTRRQRSMAGSASVSRQHRNQRQQAMACQMAAFGLRRRRFPGQCRAPRKASITDPSCRVSVQS